MLARPESAQFSLWQAWETALGERPSTSQLELRAMLVRTMSDLDTEAAEKKRAPLGSFTDAWRACAPEAANPSTAC